ncbi:hypothetical protein ABN763_07300 [Spongiivirga sp. MCCC 1A20706]
MRRTKQIKRGLIYFAIALVLSLANIALESSDTEIENTEIQLAIVSINK